MDRVEVSRRLKAARALRGVKVTELAKHEVLQRSRITANLIGETERQERDAREMELRVIADALELPHAFMLAPDPFADQSVVDDDAILAGNSEKLDTVAGQLDELRAMIRESTDKVLVARIEIQTRVLQRLEQIDGRLTELDRRFGQVTQLDDTTVVPLVRRALEVVADETRADAKPPASPPRRRQGSRRAKTPPAAGSDPDGPRR